MRGAESKKRRHAQISAFLDNEGSELLIRTRSKKKGLSKILCKVSLCGVVVYAPKIL